MSLSGTQQRLLLRVVLPALALISVVGLMLLLAQAMDTWRAAVETDIRRAHRHNGSLRHRIAESAQARSFVAETLPQYRRAVDAGFLSEPDALVASQAIRTLATRHGLTEASYAFDRRERTPLTLDGYKDPLILTTLRIGLTIEALLDADVFALLDGLQQTLAGYVLLNRLSMTRLETDRSALQRTVRRGDPVSLVRARVELDWVTLEMPQTEQARASAAE